MRILAPYTVYGGEAFKLHLFDVSADGVDHAPVTEETAYTRYVQGIAVVADESLDAAALNSLIRQLQAVGATLSEISNAIASIGIPTGTAVYIATFPFQAIQRL